MADVGLRVRFTPIRGQTSRDVLRGPLYLPAVLDEFSLDEDGAHTDYETVTAGEFSVPQFGEKRSQRRLRTTDLEALTLYWPASWLHPSHQNPEQIEKRLYRILRSKDPVEMLVRIHQIGWDDVIVRMKVTFRGISQRIRPGEADTKYWTIQIKEWKRPGVARRKHGKGDKKFPTTHKLKAGDTLESLSKRYYGSFAGWGAIARENGIPKWGKTTPLVKLKRFKPGSRIKIPKKPPLAHVHGPDKPKGGGG